MAKSVQEAQAEVIQARTDLTANVDELFDAFESFNPLMRFLDQKSSYRGWSEEEFHETEGSLYERIMLTIRSNPLPVLLITVGSGWLLSSFRKVPAKRASRSRFGAKKYRCNR
ncbi:hypothetical protein WJT86_07385 [Microvirga sp. W0021]|uniref:Uncharacterized protein n=1 Tax=Hohaiivirga grylli TaxID=3133970 RepID=A0ABV0BIU1_9HYPH